MYDETFSKYGLAPGRNFGSKNGYRSRHARDPIYYNAKVYTISEEDYSFEEVVWFGDLNLHQDLGKLLKIVGEIGPLGILNEQGNKVLELYA